jgi:hypothetical protein
MQTQKFSELTIGQHKLCRIVKYETDTDDNVHHSWLV